MFEHARDHKHHHRALDDGRGETIALRTIHQLLCEVVRNALAAAASDKPADDVSSEVVVQYAVGAYMAQLTWWLAMAQGCPQSRWMHCFDGWQSKALRRRRLRELLATALSACTIKYIFPRL